LIRRGAGAEKGPGAVGVEPTLSRRGPWSRIPGGLGARLILNFVAGNSHRKKRSPSPEAFSKEASAHCSNLRGYEETGL